MTITSKPDAYPTSSIHFKLVVPQIDVMMLYTDDVKPMLGGVTDAQLESMFAAEIASTTEALTNSDIDAEFRLVFVGPVRILTQMFRPFSEGIMSRVIVFGFRCTLDLARLDLSTSESLPCTYYFAMRILLYIPFQLNKHPNEVAANHFVVT